MIEKFGIFLQNVKMIRLFVQLKYQKNFVPLHRDISLTYKT